MTEISERLKDVEFLDQPVQVYTSSVTTTLQIRKKISAVTDFLTANRIEHQLFDMCLDLEARPRLLEIVPDEMKEEPASLLPPQIFAGDFEYCGDFDSFTEAKEIDRIYSFFRVTPPEGSAEHRAAFPPVEEEAVETEKEEEPAEDEQAEEAAASGDEVEVVPQEQTTEAAEETEPKDYNPEVTMGQGNIEDTEMFAAAMGEETQQTIAEQTVRDASTVSVEEVGEDGEIIEMSVQASVKDEAESVQDVESVVAE